MLRREIRKRKEYLYLKNKEALERTTFERKKQLRNALEAGKSIPTEMHDIEANLRTDMQYDDSRWEEKNKIDDEYRMCGITDPKIVVTTSRNPSSRLKVFAKEIRLLFPNCQRMNRGETMLVELMRVCASNDISDVIILNETRGRPDTLVISHLPFGPTAFFTLYNVVMRHDVPDSGTMSEAFPHLIFHNFTKPLGKRTMDILKYLFPVPKESSTRVISFINNSDFISFRHHVYEKIQGSKHITLKEIGPRFEMRLFRILLGTLVQTEADCEWQLRPFMNTARKRLFLGDKDGTFQEDYSDEDNNTNKV